MTWVSLPQCGKRAPNRSWHDSMWFVRLSCAQRHLVAVYRPPRMHTRPAMVSQLLPVNTRLRRMMMIIPATNNAIINHGTHGLGSLTWAGTGGGGGAGG